MEYREPQMNVRVYYIKFEEDIIEVYSKVNPYPDYKRIRNILESKMAFLQFCLLKFMLYNVVCVYSYKNNIL